MKCVEKSCPEEQLSVLVQYNHRPFMAIDSEMGYRKICKRNQFGEMVYRIGFVFDTIMTVSFLSEQCVEAALPDSFLLFSLLLTCSCHIVKKAIPYYDSILGRTIKPVTPNAYKMQFYLTDILQLVRRLDVIMIPRAEYNPIRNPPGCERAALVMCRKPCCLSRDSSAKHRGYSSGVSPAQPSYDRGRVACCGDLPACLGERRGPSAIEGSGDPSALLDLRPVRSGRAVRSDRGGCWEAAPACGRLRRLSVLVMMCYTLFASCLLKRWECKMYQIQKKMQQAITKATITLSRVFLSPIFRISSFTMGSRV